jgi:hypothetical protein
METNKLTDEDIARIFEGIYGFPIDMPEDAIIDGTKMR